MPPSKHAVLSASSSHRWLNCSPSARLEQDFADRETEAAAEGTAAHELNYTWALIMLAALGIAALLISVYLKAVDKKKGFGLEEPNIK